MRFLLWLEERQIGILSTIALHLFIISVFLIIKIRTNIEREHGIMLDLSLIDTNIEEILLPAEQQASAQEFVENLRQELNISAIPVSTADQRAVENIERMVREIRAEENITDPPPPRDTPYESAPQENIMSENEARIYDDRFPADATGERTIHTGQTTVSYDLSGRRHISMQPPVYRCRAGGTIVVNIIVNGNGYVIRAEIDKNRSNSEDACLCDNAQRYAERARFNQSSQARQQGSITYIFQAQ